MHYATTDVDVQAIARGSNGNNHAAEDDELHPWDSVVMFSTNAGGIGEHIQRFRRTPNLDSHPHPLQERTERMFDPLHLRRSVQST